MPDNHPNAQKKLIFYCQNNRFICPKMLEGISTGAITVVEDPQVEILREVLIRKFTQAIREGNAGIFAGAGLSGASGYVDWKNLLRSLAKTVKPDIEKEKDYLSVARYCRNESGSRGSQEILNAFNAEVGENENVEIIARLPISTYWTANYDKLIEKELEKQNRKVDVKMDSDQRSTALANRDAVVYKMHGDVDPPAKAVLTKDDYVLYDNKRPLFRTILKGEFKNRITVMAGIIDMKKQDRNYVQKISLVMEYKLYLWMIILNIIAKDNKNVIIPIGSTGFMAKKYWMQSKQIWITINI